MERDEAASVIKDFGGKVTSALSGKTNYIVAGDESGPAKLAKAEDLGTSILSEDGLLDLIREKSGLPTTKRSSPKQNKVKSPQKTVAVKEETKVKKEKHSPDKNKSPAKKAEDKSGLKNDIVENKPLPQSNLPSMELAQAWVDKYKPQTIKDIIGQQGAASNCQKYCFSLPQQTTVPFPFVS